MQANNKIEVDQNPRWIFAGIQGLLLAVLASTLMLPTLKQMTELWRTDETFMHCMYILPVALFLVWDSRKQITWHPPTPSLFAFLLFVPVSIIWLAGYTTDVGLVAHFTQVLIFIFIIWFCIGDKNARQIKFPLIFLIFSAPFGDALTPYLQEITADISVWFLHLVSIPVYREGLYLHTSVSVFEVAEACSGLNFLMSSLILAMVYSYLNYKSLSKSILLITFTGIVSIIANAIRAFLLIFVGEKSEMKMGFGDDHYYYGWAVFAFTLLIVFLVAERFKNKEIYQQNKIDYLSKGTTKIFNTYFALFFASFLALIYVKNSVDNFNPNIIISDSKKESINHIDTDTLIGTTFNDAIIRNIVETNDKQFFKAVYAAKQANGDLLTWHNVLWDREKFSTQTDTKTYFSSMVARYAVITDQSGNKFKVCYWYTVNNELTTNIYKIKFRQLLSIWFRKNDSYSINAIIQPANNDHNLCETDLAATVAFADGKKLK